MAKFIKFKNEVGTESIINIDSIATAYYSARTERVVVTLSVGLNNNNDVVEEKISCKMDDFIKAIEAAAIVATIK